MHGVPQALVARQAAAIGLPWQPVYIPASADMRTYENAMAVALADCRAQGLSHLITGDIFLADLRAYREAQFAAAGLQGYFPLWGEDTSALLHQFTALGFRGLTVCVEAARLGRAWLGRALDSAFASELPPSIDPCGEHGEFHTFVWDGPIFCEPVSFRRGAAVEQVYVQGEMSKAFWFLELMP
jgi:uncharacterized protein (TIGR00290 family)